MDGLANSVPVSLPLSHHLKVGSLLLGGIQTRLVKSLHAQMFFFVFKTKMKNIHRLNYKLF